MPPIDGALWTVRAAAISPAGLIGSAVANVDPATSIDLTLLSDFDVTSPNDGATDVTTDTPFTWTPTPNGGPCMVALWSPTEDLPQMRIFAATTAHVPDATLLGQSLSGHSFVWQAWWSSAFGSFDDLARPHSALPAKTRSITTLPRHVTLRR